VWAEDVGVVVRPWAAADAMVRLLSVLRGLFDTGLSPESVRPATPPACPRRTV
jgi:hypothetical protein